MTETHLYRHYDADGALLYVGISLSAIGRYQQHKQSGHWANRVAEMKVEVFPTREAALAAENAAIQSEKPLHNKAHNGPRQRSTLPPFPPEMPLSFKDENGFPILAKEIEDAEGDIFTCHFGGRDECEIKTEEWSHVMVSASMLAEISDGLEVAEEWYERARKTKAFQDAMG